MKWLLKRVLAAFAAVTVVLAGASVLIRAQYTGESEKWAVSNGTNALWIGHDWVDSDHGDGKLPKLTRRITTGEISDVYVHVGPVQQDGTVRKARYPDAEAFLSALHAKLPDVRVSAWMSQRVDEDRLDLSDDASRARIVDGATELVDAGFDGVHYNFAPVPNNDPSLPKLLDATEKELPDDAVLSSAVPQVEPLSGLALPLGLFFDTHKYWSATYLRRIAEKVDQVAIMSYDTGMPLEGMYGGFLVRQTRLALDTVPKDVQLFIGVPAPRDTESSAETPETATRAIRLGLSDAKNRRENFGTALYANFTASEAQWKDYERGWVRPDASGG